MSQKAKSKGFFSLPGKKNHQINSGKGVSRASHEKGKYYIWPWFSYLLLGSTVVCFAIKIVGIGMD